MNGMSKRENPVLARTWCGFPTVSSLMESMLNRFGSFAPEFFGSSQLESALEIKVNDKDVVAQLPCPGCCAKDISVEIVGDYLTVHVRHCEECAPANEDKHYVCRERSCAEFEESTRLPVAVNGAAATAKYVDGVLMLTIPRDQQETTASKVIAVK